MPRTRAQANPSAFNWIDLERGLSPWTTALDQYTQMANPQVVFDCGLTAGKTYKTMMQDVIYSQPSLNDYADVAEKITVWGEVNEDVWVGLKHDDPLVSKALEMDQRFPVLKTTRDIEAQSHQTEQAFETCLIEKVF